MDKKVQIGLQRFALQIRIAMLEEFKALGFGHLGGALSLVETLAALYGGVMRIDPSNPLWECRDKLVCSKGHAGPALYAALALKGYFPYEELKTLNEPGTNLPSHCDRTRTRGVDMTTGSLGQGASLAVGMALGDMLKKKDSKTFLIIGDGEANEGQVWEAFMFAAAKKLSNLTVLIDCNKKQLDGYTADILDMEDLGAKMNAFGFDTVRIDGNDVIEIYEVLVNRMKPGQNPTAVILDTVKGKGIAEIEVKKDNHCIPVTVDECDRWLKYLYEKLSKLNTCLTEKEEHTGGLR
ncbi:transketolase [Diplocloster agilis]|mgnify:CR=1 FL=1|uniref:transketolase n=1 Tax=Diplocloster agilis TaxID=2850323 RepID=UPI0008229EF7|nr:transketolase [Suonthocola fibrivorans]MCU6734750.1 transketolase [Suonthocola fibrivorans]SCJ52841.1 Transketolase 1 [uncultured Clostridium sp.]